MSDPAWLAKVAHLFPRLTEEQRQDLHRGEDYGLAYVQWQHGASDRVLRMLLERPANRT